MRIQKFLKWLFTPTMRYSNIVIFILSIILSYFLLTSPLLKLAVSSMGNFGYIGAFIGGVFYTTSFTIAPATSLFYLLGKNLNPFLIALIGGTGALFTDYVIYHFVKKSVDEIPFFSWLRVKIFLFVARSRILKKIKHSRFAPYIIPSLAGLIIASPLPDEIGVALLGAAKYEPKKFVLFTYFFNFIGIYVVATLGKFS